MDSNRKTIKYIINEGGFKYHARKCVMMKGSTISKNIHPIYEVELLKKKLLETGKIIDKQTHYDSENKIPVIRQGITATPIWNSFMEKEEFLIDAGVFQGSSGSPVFIYNQGSYPAKDGIILGNRVLFVGVLSRTLQRKDDMAFLDLGIVINSSAFLRELNNYIFRMTGQAINR